MRVDQAWHHDHAGGVDHLGVFNRQIRTHGGDLVRRDEDVGAREVADLRIQTEDNAAFEQRRLEVWAMTVSSSGEIMRSTKAVLNALLSI